MAVFDHWCIDNTFLIEGQVSGRSLARVLSVFSIWVGGSIKSDIEIPSFIAKNVNKNLP